MFVVRDVSFTLAPGEFLTLLGPSGSGKTSTLMMVAGFEAPTRGRDPRRWPRRRQLPPERRNFGVVFQGYALVSAHDRAGQRRVSVADETGRARSSAARAAMEMLERVGLADFAARRPRALSGGQQQRVALARALVFEPDALLLDEPLGALDRKLREALQVEIKEIQRRVGVSILFVTHDQDEAMMMSDRIAVMDRGRDRADRRAVRGVSASGDAVRRGVSGRDQSDPGDIPGHRGRSGGGALCQRHAWPARMPRTGSLPKPGGAALVSMRPERIRLLSTGTPAEQITDGT